MSRDRGSCSHGKRGSENRSEGYMIVGPSVKDLGQTRVELLITLSQRTRSQLTGASIASVLLTAVMLCLNDTLSPRES